MEGHSAIAGGLEIASDVLGFVSSIVLSVTALRAAPLQRVIDQAKDLDPALPGGRITSAVVTRNERKLVDVRVMERGLLVTGTGLLALSFLCSMLSHFF